MKQQDPSFSRTEKKKILITGNAWRVVQLLGALISSDSGQIHFG